MSVELIEERLDEYKPQNILEEFNALKEIYQEIALAGLSRSNFFKIGAFQGGSCLRIVHHLRRFSEDLDFILLEKSTKFQWKPYLEGILEEFDLYGLDVEVIDREKADKAIQMAFLKDTSFGKVLSLSHRRKKSDSQVLKIKVEIDVNPPFGSKYEAQYVEWPYNFIINTQDLTSLFAGKSHALLCRNFVKGRDWFDFIWFVKKQCPINWELLSYALDQKGPWAGSGIKVNSIWYKEELRKRIFSVDWKKAKNDVARFLDRQEVRGLEVWSADFFQSLLEKIPN